MAVYVYFIVLLLTILLLETVLPILLCSSVLFLLGHKNSCFEKFI